MKLNSLFENRINLDSIRCLKCRDLAKNMMTPTTIKGGEIEIVPIDEPPTAADILRRLKVEHPNHTGRTTTGTTIIPL